MTAFTPGPWRVKHRHIHAEHDSDEMGGLGWELTGPPKPMRGDFARAADAYLVAAAPDMYDALVDAVEALRTATPYTTEREWAFHAVTKALARARGES